MSWSIAEVRALAVKAARGVGMPWGMAEEAGFACQWLEQHSLPGSSMLVKLLLRYDEQRINKTLLTHISTDVYPDGYSTSSSNAASDFSESLPGIIGNQQICPLFLGTLISDGMLDSVDESGGWTFTVSQSGLLLPFFHLKYSRTQVPVSVHFKLGVHEAEIAMSKQPDLLMTFQSTAADAHGQDRQPQAEVRIHSTLTDSISKNVIAGGLVKNDEKNNTDFTQLFTALSSDSSICQWHAESAPPQRAALSESGKMARVNLHSAQRVPDTAEDAISTLQVFAARTYAPMTDESREKGAGAGTSDND